MIYKKRILFLKYILYFIISNCKIINGKTASIKILNKINVLTESLKSDKGTVEYKEIISLKATLKIP